MFRWSLSNILYLNPSLQTYRTELDKNMKLYLVHCGFYDKDICDGLYESHVNFFVSADHFEEARQKASTAENALLVKLNPDQPATVAFQLRQS